VEREEQAVCVLQPSPSHIRHLKDEALLRATKRTMTGLFLSSGDSNSVACQPRAIFSLFRARWNRLHSRVSAGNFVEGLFWLFSPWPACEVPLLGDSGWRGIYPLPAQCGHPSHKKGSVKRLHGVYSSLECLNPIFGKFGTL
jgi:hypothetical protein